MKDLISNILNKYLSIYTDEVSKQEMFKDFISRTEDDYLSDWNNFDGHIVASGFLYSKSDKKFLVLYHNEFKMYLYPGGHMDKEDVNPLITARREVFEETGIKDFSVLNINDDELVPFDIDTHLISYNEHLDLPSHKHFDFRYLFVVDKISEVVIDSNESSDYKWISIDELKNDEFFGYVYNKIEKYL